MSELETATVIADVDCVDSVEFPVRKAGTPGLLMGTFAKLKTYLLTGGLSFVPAGGTAGQVLSKVDGTDGNTHWVAAGGGGSSTLAADTDVLITSPANGDVLTYNTVAGKWENLPASGGGGGGGGLQKVVAEAHRNDPATDGTYVPDATGSAPLQVTFTVSSAQTVSVEFFAITARSAGLSRVSIKDGSGTIVWPVYPASPDPADANAYHKTAYSRGQGEGDGQLIHLKAEIPVVAGTYTFKVWHADALANATTSYYDRSLTVMFTTAGAAIPWDFKPPLAASFPTLTSGDATQLTLTDDADVGLILTTPTVTGEVARICTKALPGAGIDWTVIARLNADIFPTNYIETGLVAFESGSSKLLTHGLGYEAQYILGTRLSTLTGFRSSPRIAGSGMFSSGVRLWLRMRYDHTAGLYYTDYSRNGKTWVNFSSSPIATAFTTRADSIGLAIVLLSTAAPSVNMTCDYWWQSW